MDSRELKHRFDFHPALDNEKKMAHTSARVACYEAAKSINDLCPEGREKSLAITKLEEAMFWANAALARQENDDD